MQTARLARASSPPQYHHVFYAHQAQQVVHSLGVSAVSFRRHIETYCSYLLPSILGPHLTSSLKKTRKPSASAFYHMILTVNISPLYAALRIIENTAQLPITKTSTSTLFLNRHCTPPRFSSYKPAVVMNWIASFNFS